MEYTFEFTESNAKKASEFEAKALLYLIGIDKDKKKISLVFIDCFNDVTGTNSQHSELWDIQSKGVADMAPGLIGRSLITLFLNYCSNLKFRKFALFMPRPNESYVIDKKLTEFGINNFDDIQDKIEKGLLAEFKRRKKLSQLDPECIEKAKAFLGEVRFITDTMHPHEYVKTIADFKGKELKDTAFYESVFNEIKGQQSIKKLSKIHKAKISAIAEALQFDRHISSFDISQLLVNRLVGVDIFKPRGIPFSFLEETNGLAPDAIKDLIFECNTNVCKAFFDKNKKSIFWRFLERVLINLEEPSNLTCREIYEKSKNCRGFEYSHLEGKPGIYFVSLIKDGLEI